MDFSHLRAQERPQDERDKLLGGAPASIPATFLPDNTWLKRNFQGKTFFCFLAGTKVQLRNGQFKNIEKIVSGDEVVNSEGASVRVVSRMSRPWQGNIYRVFPFGYNIPINATPEHPFLTIDGFKDAKDLTDKDYVVIPINKEAKDKTDFAYERDPDFLKLLGLYLAEGSAVSKTSSTRGTHRVSFTLSENEVDVADFIAKTIKRIFDLDAHIYAFTKGHRIDVSFFGEHIVDIFRGLAGYGAASKQLHAKFMTLDPILQKFIFDGWYLGDGCKTHPTYATGTTVSLELALQMFSILLRNEIVPSLGVEKEHTDKKGILHQTAYRVSYAKRQEKERDEDYWRGRIINGSLIRRIRKIEKVPAPHGTWYTVYNLETEGNHTYTANFVAVHNCGEHAGTHLKAILDHLITNQPVRKSPRYGAIKLKSPSSPVCDGFAIDAGTDMRSIFKWLQKVGAADFEPLENDVTLPATVYCETSAITPAMDENAAGSTTTSYGFGKTDFASLQEYIYQHKAVILLIKCDNGFWGTANPTFDTTPYAHFVVLDGYDQNHLRCIDSADPNDAFAVKMIHKQYVTPTFFLESGAAIEAIPPAVAEPIIQTAADVVQETVQSPAPTPQKQTILGEVEQIVEAVESLI